MRLFLLLTLVAAANALAISPGDKLFVKSKDTKVRKTADLKAAALVTLQAGGEVIWLGADAKNPEWHQVSANGKKGFVHRSELTPHRPESELSENKQPLDPKSFASSGYIKCSFGPSGIAAGDPKQDPLRAELIYVEELNRQKATPEAIEAKAKELQAH